MNLPTGTLTFLFTDIEGSTRLWENHPDTMRVALERHDALLHRIIRENSGTVFKNVGDAFCAVFPLAPDALAACLEGQLAIQAEEWVTPTPIKVRMGLHTGAVDQRDNDYFGAPLNRVARLLSLGHGGQVLLSNVTQELVRDALPPGVELRDMGAHRMKDLARAEQVFQLLHSSLPSEFAPLKSLDNPDYPNNLPQQTTSFVGRERELKEVLELLSTTRVLTLTGFGGCGKSRLSLQIAAEVLENYKDGVWFVELAPVTDSSIVAHAIAAVLNIREEPGRPLLQTILVFLKTKSLLFVVDNCEHLIAESARVVASIVQACPNVRVLASSREALGISGELLYRTPPLSRPNLEDKISLEALTQYEAVRLFIDRATFHQSQFSVTNANAPALAELCYHLDGIPLAIELAAARIRAMSVEEINSRLDNLFRLLTGGVRTAMPRQQTLRALIDWSYDLLNVQERLMWQRLSQFSGGWTLEAAEQVCSGDVIEDWEVLDLLISLVDKSLVIAESHLGETRYRLLETVRQYARDIMKESDSADMTRIQHKEYYLQFAESAETAIMGPKQAEWLKRLDVEHDNLRIALDTCLNNEDGAESAMRLAGALGRYWWRRGYLRMGRDYLKVAIAHPGSTARTNARAKSLHWVGVMHHRLGEYAEARETLEMGLQIAREVDDSAEEMLCLNTLGNMSVFLRELAQAREYYRQALEVVRRLGDRYGEAMILGNMGNLAYDEEDFAESSVLYRQAITIFRETGSQIGEAVYLANLGRVQLRVGELVDAKDYLTQGLQITRQLRDRGQMVFGLWSFSQLNYEAQNYERAARLLGASDSLRDEIGSTLSTSAIEEHRVLQQAVQTALGDAEYQAHYQSGRTMNWNNAVTFALEE